MLGIHKEFPGIVANDNITLQLRKGEIHALLGENGALLYWLSGNTEFFWMTYQSLPAAGFNGIPVALLAVNNPIGVIFTGIFISRMQGCSIA